MSKLHNIFKTTRLSVWLLACVLILAATSVYAAGDQRPLAAVDILGSPDAAVDGKFAVGTATPGNKMLTVAGVIDFVGAGTVHNYFTQGPGNNMQIRSNVDESNSVGNTSYAQWNMVMGASLDVFSIRRSPASSTYNEDALFWIEGDTGKVGIATVDTSNGATIPFSLQARLDVETDTGDAIRGVSSDTTGTTYGVYAESTSPDSYGVYGIASATTGPTTIGVYGISESTDGKGVMGMGTAGVWGLSTHSLGVGVAGEASSTTGSNPGVSGKSRGVNGKGVYGHATDSTGTNYGVSARSDSTSGYDFYAGGAGTDYGPFTGAHEVLLSESFPLDIQSGLIVSATGQAQLHITEDGSVDLSSTLPTVKLADTPKDNAVLGVLVAEVTLPEDHWYIAQAGERFASINALGEGRVWVTNLNGDIKAGDAVTTSVIPGYGQRQTDNRLELFTLGKATETVEWGSVKETLTFNGQEYKVYLLAVVYTSG